MSSGLLAVVSVSWGVTVAPFCCGSEGCVMFQSLAGCEHSETRHNSLQISPKITFHVMIKYSIFSVELNLELYFTNVCEIQNKNTKHAFYI